MNFHIQFTYTCDEREKLLHFLSAGGLDADGELEFTGVWIAAETGTGFAVVKTRSLKSLANVCSQWSEYGTVKVTPVITREELPLV